MKNFIKIIIMGVCAISPLLPAQRLLEALEAPFFTSTQTRSYYLIYTKNDCGSEQYGTKVSYLQSATITAYSDVSQVDADNKAGEEAYQEAIRLVNQGGQAYANANGQCKYYDDESPAPPTYPSPRTCLRYERRCYPIGYPEHGHYRCEDICVEWSDD